MRVIANPAFRNARDNPYNALLYGAVRTLGVDVVEFTTAGLASSRWDILHLHWPEFVIARRSPAEAWAKTAAFFAALDLARMRGTRLVWTLHNLKAHESHGAVLERWFWPRLHGRVDGVISLSRAGLEQAERTLPRLDDVPSFVVPHGHYRGVYPAGITRAEARASLGIAPEATVIGHIGLIREYKNVPGLIEVVRGSGDPALVALIGGKPFRPAIEREVRAAAGDDPRIRLSLGFVENEDIQLYMAAADLVVLPYTEVLNSGSALLALSFDRPVLVPARGSMAELRETVGADWIMTYDGDLTTDVLGRALDWVRDTGRAASAPLAGLEWDGIARATVNAYETILAAPRR